jgi:hypothetical protein
MPEATFLSFKTSAENHSLSFGFHHISLQFFHILLRSASNLSFSAILLSRSALKFFKYQLVTRLKVWQAGRFLSHIRKQDL